VAHGRTPTTVGKACVSMAVPTSPYSRHPRTRRHGPIRASVPSSADQQRPFPEPAKGTPQALRVHPKASSGGAQLRGRTDLYTPVTATKSAVAAPPPPGRDPIPNTAPISVGSETSDKRPRPLAVCQGSCPRPRRGAYASPQMPKLATLLALNHVMETLTF
jgi:hypothetical protein